MRGIEEDLFQTLNPLQTIHLVLHHILALNILTTAAGLSEMSVHIITLLEALAKPY